LPRFDTDVAETRPTVQYVRRGEGAASLCT
jgi:hypothetical protein